MVFVILSYFTSVNVKLMCLCYFIYILINLMRILGIDPGFDRVGVCILDKIDNQYKYVFSCLISTDKSMSLYDRVLEIAEDLDEIIKKSNLKKQ